MGSGEVTKARARYDVTLSVVLYHDYEEPTVMVESLVRETDPAIRWHLYAVDNSCLVEGDSLCAERDAFARLLASTGYAEYVDAGGNLGFGRGNNIALERSDSEYHVFVNPDVVFIGDALSALKAFMDSNPDIGMCCPRLVDGEGNLQYTCRRGISVLDAFNRMVLKNRMAKRDRWHAMKDEDYSRPFDVPFAQGSFLMGRTDLLKELGGFDDDYFMYLEDADLCRRVNEASRLSYCPDATVIHKWEKGSHRDGRLLRIHMQSYMTYFRKWGLRLA